MKRIGIALAAIGIVAAAALAARAQTGTFTLSVTQPLARGLTAGHMSSNPPGIDGLCVSTCHGAFPAGTVVTVSIDSAPPTWGGACKGQTGKSCRVTMDANKSVVADRTDAGAKLTLTFSHDPFWLVTVNPDGQAFYSSCRPTPCSKVYPKGSTVTLAPSTQRGGPDVAWVRWEGSCAGQSSTCTLIMDADKHVDSVWRDAKATTGEMGLKIVSVSSEGAYKLTPPDKIINNCTHGICLEHYAAGVKVTVHAYLTSNVQFDHWEGCDAPNGRICVMTMDKSKLLKGFWVYNGR